MKCPRFKSHDIEERQRKGVAWTSARAVVDRGELQTLNARAWQETEEEFAKGTDGHAGRQYASDDTPPQGLLLG